MNFTDDQIERYSRHLLLPEVGWEGQERLLRAKVVLVGAGGLGSPVGYYLAAAGVEHDRRGPGVDAELWLGSIPVLEGTRRLIARGEVPGGTRANLEHATAFTSFDAATAGDDRLLLAAAQTSGGLLAALPADAADATGWARACAAMRRLNAAAAGALRPARPHAVTDVSGFGLLGHLHELLAASGVDAELWLGSIPVLDGTRPLIARGEVPGGTRANLEHAAAFTSFDRAGDRPATGVKRRRGDRETPNKGDLLYAVSVFIHVDPCPKDLNMKGRPKHKSAYSRKPAGQAKATAPKTRAASVKRPASMKRISPHEVEALFQETSDLIPHGIGHLSPAGRWMRANGTLCEITGYSRQELLARTLREITHPEDVADVQTNLQQALAGGIPIRSLDIRLVRKDRHGRALAEDRAPGRTLGVALRSAECGVWSAESKPFRTPHSALRTPFHLDHALGRLSGRLLPGQDLRPERPGIGAVH